MKKGKLLIISGFSGVGKGTVVNALLNQYDNYKISISATTRQPRENEMEGVHYFFRTREEFESMIEKNELLEYAEYVGNYYGTPKAYVEEQLNNGKNVILEIESRGAIQVKKIIPEAMMIFIMPPTAETLRSRLIGRQTESEEVINQRLLKACEEIEILEHYEYFVVNDKIDDCVENINRIVNNNSPALLDVSEVQNIKNDIMKFMKGE